jgi:uncharacterized protein (TIGR03437 family)
MEAKMEIPACKLPGLVVAFCLLIQVTPAFAQPAPLQIKSFSVGPDTTLTYPNNPADPAHLNGFPDEHTTIIPPAPGSADYLVFGAGQYDANFGAVVLQTTDLKNFIFATAFGYNPQVMTGPVPTGQCDPTHTTEFDGNYGAPGSVVQDPTLPAGNFIMIYEAENHCPGGVFNMPFYATTGFARSSDGGKTWPAPINGVLGGPARHPVLQSSDPQPSVPHGYEGDALPSAFVDLDADHNYYLYVTYAYLPATGNDDGRIRVARAKLGADPLSFEKWYNGSFSQRGIGGSDTGVTPSTGCGGGQTHSEINYNDDLGVYLLIFVCTNGPADSRVGAWYYSTATSLDVQNWTTPQMIQNSQFPVITPCPGLTVGSQFDGWYPSSVSPGAAAGHTKLTGYFFFLNGCAIGARQFMSRTFTIVAGPPLPEISLVANAEGEAPTIAPNTWVEIKGSNLAPVGYSSPACAPGYCWQTSDFVGNKMPSQLDNVSATVNGKGAYVYYISPTQVNILTPPDALSGTAQVEVTNNGTPSTSLTVQAQALSPSFFVFNGGPYVAATHVGGALLGPTTLYPGLTTPGQPNEIVVLYANGFGATNVPVQSGSVTQSGMLSPLPVVKIGGVSATVQFAGLVAPGEFQFNVVVPANTPNGDQPITATYGGLTTQAGTLITILN